MENNTPAAVDQPTASDLPDCLVNLSSKETARVLYVTDGDTILVEIGGREHRLRYIGIDTPEVHPELEPFGPQAADRNRALVAGKILTLYRDRSNVDPYGRLLRYVVTDGVFINEALVREGMADAKDYPPDTACSRDLHQAEDLARAEELGIWQKP